ncbi:transposase [Streptomyces klenkii]|uniref:transposase n=1 Tax=Streptomyces klenkii TaxID=1420899 RepID=UPI001319F108|nr:transposase [Streptomyces klenkii]
MTPKRRPQKRPESLLGDKGYDSNPNRHELRKRGILPAISRKDSPDIHGLGKLRYVVEQTFALFHQFNRLRTVQCPEHLSTNSSPNPA